MHAIVRRIFGRLRTLNPKDEEAKLIDADNDVENNELRMNVQASEASEQVIPEEMDKTAEPPPETESKSEVEGDENLDRLLLERRGRAACQIEEGWYEVMAG